MTRLAVIAGVRFYREGLADVFRHVGAFEVVGTASDAAQALTLLRDLHPHVVLVASDFASAPALVHKIATAQPDTRVVVVGIEDDHPDVLPLAEAGVAGYVTNDASTEELIDVVTQVAHGDGACSPRITAALLERVATLARERQVGAKAAQLTTRELEIVALIDLGMSNKQIASDLCIEVTTVKNHVHNILEKLNVERRGEAAAAVRREI
jgi:two-component system, NarL family, nitrate/nitrite response regulator NarL